jgi:hypothetical protein
VVVVAVLTVTKYIKIILPILCLALGGCSQSSKTEEKSVSFLPEIPKEEPVAPLQQEIPDRHHCYFIPPKGWDLADQQKLSPRVKICFIGKSLGNLLPSVNLATEEVDISLKAYVDIVKKDCESDPNCLWRDLGRYDTPLGEGRLTEREVKTQWGTSRQIQLIVIKDQKAYILTAGALKEEFSRHYENFEKALRSLTITDDLTAQLIYVEKKESLQKLIGSLQNAFKETKAATADEAFQSTSFQKESWEPFQQKIINDFTEMGPFWQILLLRDLQYKLVKETL